MDKILFGQIGKQKIYKYTIAKGNVSADFIDYGARIQSLRYCGKDIVLGYNTLTEYVNSEGYLGATVGRFANRIANAKFTLNGKEYCLTKNEGEDSLHGGLNGFDSKVWHAHSFDDKIEFTYLSIDGEEGYPGNLSVKVTYTITDSDSLKIEYRAVSDADTVISLTNHAYFNLDGESSGDVFDTELFVDATEIVDVNENLIPNGKLRSVENTEGDFTKFKKLGNYFESKDFLIRKFGGYDFCYALEGDGFRKVAEARSNKSGISLEVYTDKEGMQFYTETILEGKTGKRGVYQKGCGFCLETQAYPNAVNCPEYPSAILRKGEQYNSVTEYKLKKF